MDQRRLNQARGGSAEAEANAISMYNAIFLFVLFLLDGSSVHKAGLCSLELFSSPSPSVASQNTAVDGDGDENTKGTPGNILRA